MKALAVFPNDRQVRLTDVEEPRISRDDQVLVKMLEVGLCGTDLEIANFEYGSPPPGSEFLILGHEGLGQVVETGSQVTGLQPGDLVVPTVRRPCGEPNCRPCATGHQDFCFTGKFKERGIHQLHGFMTAAIVEEERYLHRVPASLRNSAVLVEPLTISRKALRQIRNIQDRLPWECVSSGSRNSPSAVEKLSCRRALVLGAGPVGLLGAMTLALAGFETSVYSRVGAVPERARIARQIGCDFIAAEEHPAAELAARVGEVDVIFEAVGASQLAFDVLELLAANAIFIFTGVPGRKTRATINTDVIMRNLVLKNQALAGTVNAAPEDFQDAIQALAAFEQQWPGVPERLKTHPISLDEVPAAMKQRSGIKQYIQLPSSLQE